MKTTKLSKRIFSILLTLCMLVGTIGVLPMSVFAAGEAKITPSATGGTYDESTNTLTVVGGGEVSFTASEGIEFDTVEGTKQPKDGEDTTVDDNVSATLDGAKWVVTLPNEDAEYIFRGYYYDINNDFTLAECTVVVEEKTGYTLTINYAVTSSGITVGSGSETVTGISTDTVVDLSKYWPASGVTGSDGKTYYFAGFTKKGEIVIIDSVTVTGDIELEAAWTAEEQITVTFDTKDGAMPYAKTRVTKNIAISDMNSRHIPVRAGYDFAGWSLADDGMSDSSDTEITADCTLYAVWQTYMPSYDDSWNPPAPGTTVEIGGDYDAVRISDGVIGKVIDNGNEVVVKFPDGASGTLTDSALVAAKDNLQDGESLQIAIKNVGSEVLPDSLTEQEPFEDDEVLFDSGVLTGTVIFTEQELLDLKVIEEDNDEITWNELKYLYHYMTITDLKSLGLFIEDFLYDTDPQVQVWLAEMIERDTIKPLNMQELMDMADLTDEQWELLADADLNDPPIGHLRQAGLTVEQMRKLYDEVRILIGELNDNDKLSNCNELLGWLDDAIAQKELEQENATITSMTVYGLEEYAELTDKQMQKLTDMGLQNLDNPSVGQIKKLDLTLEQMELLYAEIDRARSAEYNPEYQAEYDVLLKWLEKAIAQKEQGNKDAPTYIQVGGTSDGINPVFIGAVDVNIGAVKADGTTTPIAVKADRSDAVAWSTTVHVPKLLLEAPEWNTENIRAYKVLDNGTLETRASNVIVNADGTLTLSAMSDGNSTYVFLYEPSTVTLEPEIPNGLSTGAIVAIVIACVVVLAGIAFVLCWFIIRKRKQSIA